MSEQKLRGIVKEDGSLFITDTPYQIYKSAPGAAPSVPYDLTEFAGRAIVIKGEVQDSQIYAAEVFLPGVFNPGVAVLNNRMGTTLKPADKNKSVSWKGKWSFTYSIEPPTEENPPWNSPLNRDPEAILKIVKFLEVETTARYQPRDGWTCCTIFVSDATRLLHAEIPLDPLGKTKWHNRGANKMIQWIEKVGIPNEGWQWVANAEKAQARANEGYPVVGMVNEAGSPGHVVLVIPGKLDQNGLPLVAMAGLKNFSSGRWGHERIRYITHE